MPNNSRPTTCRYQPTKSFLVGFAIFVPGIIFLILGIKAGHAHHENDHRHKIYFMLSLLFTILGLAYTAVATATNVNLFRASDEREPLVSRNNHSCCP